jgi:ribosomal protein S18 acetylase RimI-like enzyme
MVKLEPITPENVFVYKTIRLRALLDSPTAFSSTYAQESQRSDDEWLQRARLWSSPPCTGYLAFEEDTPCGLVACFGEAHNTEFATVISMWVDSAYRRTGAGTALIEALKSWAFARGLCELRLMVTSVNTSALRFYERLGFHMTGKTEPYPNDPAIIEHEMALRLHP